MEKNAAMIEPGLDQATEEFRKSIYAEVKQVLDAIYATHGHGQWKQKIMVNDRIADSVFQQVLTRADEYQVFATPNLNGDYLSDACAAQVGGLGNRAGREYRRRLRRVSRRRTARLRNTRIRT